MFGKFLGLSGSASFHLLGWNTRPYFMCRNLGAMGNHGTFMSEPVGISSAASNYFIYFFNHKSKNLSYTT